MKAANPELAHKTRAAQLLALVPSSFAWHGDKTANSQVWCHAASITSLLILITAAAHADALIDPTRPAFAPTKSLPAARVADPVARVTAIFQNGERRVAVFDGRVVKVGDHVGEIVIQEILSDGVRYARAGRVEIARLPRQAASVRSDRKDSIRENSP